MYCTLDDLEKILPESDLIELTDDTIPPVAVNAANANKAITDSSEMIDGYLRGKYDLPLDPAPGLLNTLCGQIAVYLLYARRHRLEMPEGVNLRYKNAVKTLEEIQKGNIKLGSGQATIEPGGTVQAVQEITAADRYSKNNMSGF